MPYARYLLALVLLQLEQFKEQLLPHLLHIVV
jgi:hypothetical protein